MYSSQDCNDDMMPRKKETNYRRKKLKKKVAFMIHIVGLARRDSTLLPRIKKHCSGA
jgi:hypothetical protein